MNTEIAKLNDAKVTVVADPFDASKFYDAPEAVIASMTARKLQRVTEFNALGEIGDAPLEAVKELRRAIEDDDKTLLNYGNDLREALLTLSGFKAVTVQMSGAKKAIDPISVRGKLRSMVAVLKAREDAEKPKIDDASDWVIFVNCGGAEIKKILTAIEKIVGKGFDFGKTTPDKQFAAMCELKKQINN